MKYKPLLLNLLAAGCTAASVTAVEPTPLPLIPWPTQVQTSTGAFSLDAHTAVVSDPMFAGEATQLAAGLGLFKTVDVATNRILLTTNGASSLEEEGYLLEANPHGVIIRARTPAGAFYGCQTLQQLAPLKTIPGLAITDAPRYPWRGLMLDVSRHFFDKSTLEQVVDWMAKYKLNRFHLHLTDDQGWRLEIKAYPELTHIGARGDFSDTNAPPRYFTRADLQEIVAYAAQRHIVVVPEIDMPGHAGSATRTFPQLDGGMHTFDPAKPQTYVFLQTVLRDVMEIFPSPWIHFGGDEVNLSQWQVPQTLKHGGVETPAQMEKDFLRRMSQFIAQQGRVPMGWDDVVAAHPATNTVIYWWRHNKPELLEQALNAGYPVVLTPRTPCYFDYPQDESFPQNGWKLRNTPAVVYAGPQIPESLPAAARKKILGVEACVWTERIGTVPYLEFTLMPRLAALSEMAWTPDDLRDYARFDARLQPFLEQYRQAGIHFYDKSNPRQSLRSAQSPTASAAAPTLDKSLSAR